MLSEGENLYLVGHDTLARWDGSEWAYHLPDALGSVRQVADGTGAVVSAREWTPYGVEMGTGQAGLGYTGEWWDADAGLEYLRTRGWSTCGRGGMMLILTASSVSTLLYPNFEIRKVSIVTHMYRGILSTEQTPPVTGGTIRSTIVW
jgi:hypothetical protein